MTALQEEANVPVEYRRPSTDQHLEITDLRLSLDRARGTGEILRGVTISAAPGEVLAVAGESGCGKSSLLRSIVRLTPPGASLTGGIKFGSTDVMRMRRAEVRKFRATTARMMFQDPWSSLHPMRTIGWQLCESVQSAFPQVDRKEAIKLAASALESVNVTDIDARLRSRPHEVSGGQAQRIMIAMALLAKPSVLLCDEPTTALDVTTQSLILELLRDLAETHGITVLIATHDLGVIRSIADRVAVMYAGRVVEVGAPERTLLEPFHPYTYALVKAAPGIDRDERLAPIAGMSPSPFDGIEGCSYRPRCPYAVDQCAQEDPELIQVSQRPVRSTACLRHESYANPTAS